MSLFLYFLLLPVYFGVEANGAFVGPIKKYRASFDERDTIANITTTTISTTSNPTTTTSTSTTAHETTTTTAQGQSSSSSEASTKVKDMSVYKYEYGSKVQQEKLKEHPDPEVVLIEKEEVFEKWVCGDSVLKIFEWKNKKESRQAICQRANAVWELGLNRKQIDDFLKCGFEKLQQGVKSALADQYVEPTLSFKNKYEEKVRQLGLKDQLTPASQILTEDDLPREIIFCSAQATKEDLTLPSTSSAPCGHYCNELVLLVTLAAGVLFVIIP